MENLTDRKDKLISNIYKARIEALVVYAGVDIYWCGKCKRLLTKEQALAISCTQDIEIQNEKLFQSEDIKANDPKLSYIHMNGSIFYNHDMIFKEEAYYLL